MFITQEASPEMHKTSGVGVGHLHADRGREAVAHGAETARGHPAQRLLELEVLGGPHLVLADIGRDVDVAVPGQPRRGGGRRYCGLMPVRLCRKRSESTSAASPRSGPTRAGPCRGSTLFERRFQAASMAPSVRSASPTIATSTGMFLLIEDGSMSTWIFVELRARSRRAGRSRGRRSGRRCRPSRRSRAWPCWPRRSRACRACRRTAGRRPDRRRGPSASA